MTAKKYITNREYLRNVRENYSIKKLDTIIDRHLINLCSGCEKNGNTDFFRVSNQCEACLKSWLDRKYIALRGDA